MNPQGIVADEDLELIEQARQEKARAEANWRQTILDVAARTGSVRETAKAARISPDTITQWRKQTR